MSHLPLPMLENYREIGGVMIFFMKDHRSAQAVSNVKIYCHADLAIILQYILHRALVIARSIELEITSSTVGSKVYSNFRDRFS